MENYQRIRFTAANYYSLQGLRYVPALLFALIVTVGEQIRFTVLAIWKCVSCCCC